MSRSFGRKPYGRAAAARSGSPRFPQALALISGRIVPRPAYVGDLEDRLRRARGRGKTAADWERRKAEQAARKAAIMADPVQGFYLRHGHPADRAGQITTPDAAAEDEEPGTA